MSNTAKHFYLLFLLSLLLLLFPISLPIQAAERQVARMGDLQATVSESGWCQPTVAVRVYAPGQAHFTGDTRQLQLLAGGVRQILSLECPALRELQMTGLVGDQIVGHWQHLASGQLVASSIPAPSAAAPEVTLPRAADSPPARQQIAELQTLLSQLGYQPGPIDGLMGQHTRSAVAAFQRDRQLPSSPVVNEELLAQVRFVYCGDPTTCEGREAGTPSAYADTSRPPAVESTTPALPHATSPSASMVTAPLPGATTTDSTRATAPLPGAAPSPALGETGDALAAATPSHESTPLPSQDYSALARQFGLRTARDLPVVASANNRMLTEEQSRAAIQLFDFAAIGIRPDLVDKYPGCWALNYLTQQEREGYISSDYDPVTGGRGVWIGANEFEKARSREAFLSQHAERIKAQAIPLPLEVITIQQARLPTYNAQAEGFYLKEISITQSAHGNIQSYVESLKDFSRFLGASFRSPHCAISLLEPSPVSASFPDLWSMSESRAEEILNHLHERRVYIAISFRIDESAVSGMENPNLPEQPIPLRAEITSVAIYQDSDLETLIDVLPIKNAEKPILLAGMPEAPRFPEVVTLNEVTLALLMLRDHGEMLDDNAWRQLMISQANADRAYYSRARAYDTGSQQHVIRRDDYDQGYTPFFPNGFTIDSRTHFSDDQLSLFKEWMRQRASGVPDELTLHVIATTYHAPPAEIRLPTLDERRADAGLIEALTDRGYSIYQVLQPDQRQGSGRGQQSSQSYLAGPGINRIPLLILPNIATHYIPALSEAEINQIFQGGGEGELLMEVRLKIDTSELVTINDKTEALLLHSTPTRLLSHDRTRSEILYEHQYDVAALAPDRSEVEIPLLASPAKEVLPLSAEVMDLLMVKHLADAVTDADYQQMMLARWEYEASLQPGRGEPEWGRFFVPGRPKPDEDQQAALLPRFKEWTMERAALLPDRFRIYQGSVRIEENTPISLLDSENYPFGDINIMSPGSEVRSCQNYARNMPTLSPACDFLEHILNTTPAIYPFGLGYQAVGPRIRCGAAMGTGRFGQPETAYCQARRAQFEQISRSEVEPGFRDIFLQDKEIFFPGSPADVASIGWKGLIVDIAVTDARIADEPLSIPFIEATKRVMAFQERSGIPEHQGFEISTSSIREALGIEERRGARHGRAERAPPDRYFIFDLEVLSAQLVNTSTAEPITNFELREARTLDLMALELPEPPAIPDVTDAPFGPDIVGMRLGMSFDEADDLIRSHMDVGQILIRDRTRNPRYASGEFETFSSSRVYVSEDKRELIVLYDEPPAARDIVLGVTRKLSFPKGQVTSGMLLSQLRNKYGQEGWSDQDRTNTGWGEGFSASLPADYYSHPCFPNVQHQSYHHWMNEDGTPIPPPASRTDRPLSIPNMNIISIHHLQGRMCGPSIGFDSSAVSEQADSFTIHLTDPNLYMKFYEESQRIVKSGEASGGGTARNS